MMKTDVYTKIVLTVIAIGLFANFFKGTDIVTTAQAQSVQPVPAAITEQPKPIDVNIVSVDGMPIFLRYVNTTNAGRRALLPISVENTDGPVDVTMNRYEDSFNKAIRIYNVN